MTQLAGIGRNRMGGRFIGGISAGVAHRTAISGLVVCKRYDKRYPDIGTMTGFAQLCGQWVGGRFISPSTHPVMTSGTAARLASHSRVIKYYLQPISSIVANIAGFRRGNMSGTLTDSNGTIMTVLTHICRLSVIKWHDDRYPHISGMASIALFAGQRMGGRFVSARTHTVMTAGTVARLTCYGGVIKQNLQPIGGVMTHITGLRGGNVCRTFTGGHRAIMTVLTQIRGLTVINRQHKALPSRASGMAGFTQIGSDRVRRGFIGGIGSSMTGRTGIGGLIVRER